MSAKPAARTSSSDAGIDGDVEHRTGARPDDLRVERVDRTRGQHDGVDARGLGRPQDGSEVARITESVGHDHERRHRGGRHIESRHPDDGEVRLRVLGRRHPFDDAVRQLEDRCGNTHGERSPGATYSRFDLPAAGDRLTNEDGALDDEAAFFETRTAAPEEAPQSLNLRVVERQWFVQGVAPRAQPSPGRRAPRRRRRRGRRDRRGSCGRPRHQRR